MPHQKVGGFFLVSLIIMLAEVKIMNGTLFEPTVGMELLMIVLGYYGAAVLANGVAYTSSD
jgi:hypothetical protein